MAIDIFIKFEGGKFPIEGECMVEGFLKQLEAQSFSEGFSNPRDPSGQGNTASRTNASDIVISSVASEHSNLLKKSMFENNCISKATVTFVKQEGTKVEKYDVRTYTNVYITSYSCSKANEGPGYESWSFQATEIHDAYFTQDPNTHALTESTTSTLNLAASTTSA